MSEKEYAKSIIDIIPDEYMDEVISDLVSKHILEKYHKAFEELAK